MSQQRIYYILNARWPTVKAHGLQVARTCEALVEAGADLTLIVPDRHVHHADPVAFYGLQRQFPVLRLWSPDWVVSGFIGRVLFVIQQVAFALRVTWYLRRVGGIVYSRDPYVLWCMSFIRGNLFWEVHRFPKRINTIYRQLIHRCRGIFVLTEGLRQRFLDAGASDRRVAIIPDAVSVEEFAIPETMEEARQRLNLVVGVPIVTYVGQLSTLGESKGLEVLLDAFARLQQSHVTARLLIVGGSRADIALYQQIADRLGIHESVQFAGFQPHNTIPLYLRASDVLVMPFPWTEHYAHFMSPLKLFEYMAAGKPIVTTDLPSVREIVGDSDVVYSRPDDAVSLARAIIHVLGHPDEARIYAERVAVLAEQYTWKSRAHRLLRVLFLDQTNVVDI